ncbi:hypothetical protein [Xenorhabdus bovienii]|nr:hypothetical protein [Xenorhabdus bovienii]
MRRGAQARGTDTGRENSRKSHEGVRLENGKNSVTTETRQIQGA